MNIFHLSASPRESVIWHADPHVLKMGIEAAQMLSTAWHVAAPREIRMVEGVPYLQNQYIYKATHTNHPMALWVRENAANYSWTWQYGNALMDEYWHRWGKDSRLQHATRVVINALQDIPDDIPDGDFTPPPQCMPEEFRNDNYIEAYRAYYKYKLTKPSIQRYYNRERPPWIL